MAIKQAQHLLKTLMLCVLHVLVYNKQYTVADPGGGSGGPDPPPPPPIRPDACLRLKFLHRQDRISLFNWLIFLMKHALLFATKLNSRDIPQNVIVFGYPPTICSPLLTKQYFPRQRRPAFTD